MLRYRSMSQDSHIHEIQRKLQSASLESCPLPSRLRMLSGNDIDDDGAQSIVPSTLDPSLEPSPVASDTKILSSKGACLVPPDVKPITYFVGEILDHEPDLAERYGYESFHRTQNVHHSSTFQYSVHLPSRGLRRELDLVFSNVDFSGDKTPVYVLPTFQPSHYDLVAVSPETNWERNILLEYFMALVKRFVTAIQAKGYWADATDPASGYPVYSPRGTSLYPDVEGCWKLLKYPTVQAGCCKVLSHPSWGTKMYPGTMFSTAPVEVISSVLDAVFENGPKASVKSLQNNRPLPRGDLSPKWNA